jgi:hypothetical protein
MRSDFSRIYLKLAGTGRLNNSSAHISLYTDQSGSTQGVLFEKGRKLSALGFLQNYDSNGSGSGLRSLTG